MAKKILLGTRDIDQYLLSMSEAARVYHVSRCTLWKWGRDGRMKTYERWKGMQKYTMFDRRELAKEVLKRKDA